MLTVLFKRFIFVFKLLFNYQNILQYIVLNFWSNKIIPFYAVPIYESLFIQVYICIIMHVA